jgi:plasmid maintenance system killer protein
MPLRLPWPSLIGPPAAKVLDLVRGRRPRRIAGHPLFASIEARGAAAACCDASGRPGNRLEALHGDRQGQFSIRVNDQWRICFVWCDNEAWDAEIVDYH